METPNIYVSKLKENQWTRYNNDSIDLQLDEIVGNENGIVLHDDCVKLNLNCVKKYVLLTGSVDLIFPTSVIATIQIHAIWDIVWARALSYSSSNTVLYFRKTGCIWVEKKNGVITNEYKFIKFDDGSNHLILENIDPYSNELYINIHMNQITKVLKDGTITKAYSGKWFNKKDDLPLSYYFFPKLFKCDDDDDDY